MNAVLVQLAVAVGFFLGVLVFIVCIVQGAGPLTAVLRASITLVVSSLIVTLFFRFFARVLYDFIAQKQKEQQEKQEAAEDQEAPSRRERRREVRGRRTEGGTDET